MKNVNTVKKMLAALTAAVCTFSAAAVTAGAEATAELQRQEVAAEVSETETGSDDRYDTGDEQPIVCESTEAVYSAAAKTALNGGEFEGYSTINYVFDQFANETAGGIYTLDTKGQLWFYSLKDNSDQVIYDFTSINKATVVQSYDEGDRLYVLSKKYVSGNYNYEIYVYNAAKKSLEKTIALDHQASAIGADSKGRIYLADSSTLYLLDANGKQLATKETERTIYCFSGFDENNGNFYYEGYLNYIYWGYDHDTNSLFCGNVDSNNNITLTSPYLGALFQRYFANHNRSADMIGGKYMVWSEHFMRSAMVIIDSSGFDINGTSLTPVATVARAETEGDGALNDTNSFGVRAVYNKSTDTFIFYNNNNTIAEIDHEGNLLSKVTTSAHVFSLFITGDRVTAIEKDSSGSFFAETFNWKRATQLNISASSDTVRSGEILQLTATHNGELEETIKWSSGDNKTAVVTQSGKVYGIAEGTAEIKAELDNGVFSTYTVKVTAGGSAPALSTATKGASGSNVSANNYSVWTSVMNSNLYQDTDGTLGRVEYTGKAVIAEKYSAGGKTLTASNTIPKELTAFGGFFSGSDNNYLVFGDTNSSYSDDKEVLRVVKYTKDWKRVSSVSVKGANTYVPFDAGSLRMTELDGKLYIHTCHTMYADSDNVNHQANMSYVVDEASMTVTDQYYNVYNLSEGFVSHSFNQFVETDGDFIFRADHAESSTISMNGSLLSARGIVITRFYKGSVLSNVSVVNPVSAGGSGNYTGMSIGGFELSEENCLTAYNLDADSAYGPRNVYLNVTDKLFNTTKSIKITSYAASGTLTACTPQMVKLNDYTFMVMWEEKNTNTGAVKVKYVLVDGAGNIASNINTISARLSDCQPILCSDGNVRWYVTNNSSPVIYSVYPFAVTKLRGDINNDGKVDTKDAMLAVAYAKKTAAPDSTDRFDRADVNGDGKLDSKDAMLIIAAAKKTVTL